MTVGSCIEVKNLSFSYDGATVLEDISFAVRSGDYLAVIGPNGSGKTTLVKILLGLYKATSGSIKIFGNDISHFKERHRIGYVPQNLNQSEYSFPATVYEIVKSGLTAKLGILKGFRKDHIESIEKAMDIAEVTSYRNSLAGKLSGGQRQKIFIARALVSGPDILILDEPVAGVDVAAQERFYKFLEALNKNQGITIIFVSHDLGVIMNEASSILCINKKVCCYASPEDLVGTEFLEHVYGRKVYINKHTNHHHGYRLNG